MAARGAVSRANRFHASGQLGLVHIPEEYEREDQIDAGVGMTGAPEVLTKGIIDVAGIPGDEKPQ